MHNKKVFLYTENKHVEYRSILIILNIVPSFSMLEEHMIRLKQQSNSLGSSSYNLIRSKMKAFLSDAIWMIETWPYR
jgi:hypothetical protein